MLKCEKCGIEYPSEIDFHREGAEGPVICLSCFQASGGSQESGPAAEGEKAGVRVSKGGLIAAALFIVGGVVAARDPEGPPALPYFSAALALAIRCFLPEMTLGRGILTTLGGMMIGVILVFLTLTDSLANLIVPVIMAFACLWSGFKRGRIQWGKKKKRQP